MTEEVFLGGGRKMENRREGEKNLKSLFRTRGEEEE